MIPEANLLETQFRRLPKVELHCHLLGTVRESTFREWVFREKAPISEAEILSFFGHTKDSLGAIRVLRALDRWLIKLPDDLWRLTYEYLESAARHQVRYSEFFWNPTGTLASGSMTYSQALPAILEAMRAAQKDFGILSALIPAIDREAPARAALEMVQAVTERANELVVGIGIDYKEPEGPPELFVDAFTLARQRGLKTTAHAGEFGCPATNIKTCIQLLKVDRLDHAYTAVEDPAVASLISDLGLLVTVVPTNSYYRRILPADRWAHDHPIRKMPDLGLAIHPNTDDPTLHRVTPTQAWLMMHRDFQFNLQQIKSFMLNGVEGAWLDPSIKLRWKSEFTHQFQELFDVELNRQ